MGLKKVLQYFGNFRQNSTAPFIFAEVVKLTNYIRLWDAEVTWYSSSATRKIFLYNSEHSLGIHAFRHKYVKLATVAEDDQKALFSIATTHES